MAELTNRTLVPQPRYVNPMHQVSMATALLFAALSGVMLFRWLTFSQFSWSPFEVELYLSSLPGFIPYVLYIAGVLINVFIAYVLWRQFSWAKWPGLALSGLGMVGSLVYFSISNDFYSACIIFGIHGMLFVSLIQHAGWTINYPAAFWVVVFFIMPLFIVFFVSLGDRSLYGEVIYPEFSFANLGKYFDDYARFFSKIGDEFLYVKIFWRSFRLALLNTIICLLFGYPFAYWIARQPAKYRNVLVFLVMIPFWTNFLVRTYAWMLILRDSGIINNLWTIGIHDLAVSLSANNAFFAWLADLSANKLPLLFTQPAVFMGLFYGYFPFVVLPLYSNLEKMDWSLLEAAADLGASNWYRTTRVLLPLSMPGIVAAAIIVFIPSLGAYVTPDLLGGGKVILLGNLLQQQFMTSRNWPFGSAVGFIMMTIMLAAVIIYYRVGGRDSE